MTDAEQIEGVITMFNDMGIQVYDEAPDAETLLITENAPAAVADEDVEEEAEAALATVDAEFGRTTDPVRMYMREMGSVELLTREGEIEIAKRIEDGLKHMIMAISSCPTTIEEILDLADQVEKDEMRIDELVDGLVDPNARTSRRRRWRRTRSRTRRRKRRRTRTTTAPRSARPDAAQAERARALQQDPPPVQADEDGRSQKNGYRSPQYARTAEEISAELMLDPLHRAHQSSSLCDGVRGLVDTVRPHEREIQELVREEGQHAAPALHQGVPGQRDLAALDQRARSRRAGLREALERFEPAILEQQQQARSTCRSTSASRSRT